MQHGREDTINRLKEVLVTGATGFVGSCLAKRLASEGVRVYAPVRAESLSPADSASAIEYIPVNDFSETMLRKVLSGIKKIDCVYHLAAFGVNPDNRDPRLIYQGNLGILTALLGALEGSSVSRFIYTGSCSQYGTLPKKKISEDTPQHPTSLYGAAKAACEMFGSAFSAALSIPFVTLRLFGIYGIGESERRLVPYLINRLKKGEPVDLTPGNQMRDLLYIDDVIDALIIAGSNKKILPYTSYNICSGRPVTVKQVAFTVADMLKARRKLLCFGKRPYRSDEPMWLAGSNARFCRATGWKPKVSMEEGVTKMLAVY